MPWKKPFRWPILKWGAADLLVYKLRESTGLKMQGLQEIPITLTKKNVAERVIKCGFWPITKGRLQALCAFSAENLPGHGNCGGLGFQDGKSLNIVLAWGFHVARGIIQDVRSGRRNSCLGLLGWQLGGKSWMRESLACVAFGAFGSARALGCASACWLPWG
jgi:hypothetical protein